MRRLLSLLAALSVAYGGVAVAAKRNKVPTATLTSPTNGATFSAPANIALAATAADADGSVAKVDFYRGSTLIGTDTTAPYSFQWNNVAAGSYSLTARATDNAGAIGNSAAVSVTVTAPVANLILSPANGANVYSTSVAVSGTFNGDGSTTVLVDNGNTSVIATKNGNNYSASMPVFIGPNTITVTAARRDRTFDTASVTINGLRAPQVVFKSPTTTSFETPANIPFVVDAYSAGASISKVEFLRGGALLATVTSPPYEFTWNNAPAGNHSIVARAVDSNNQSGQSALEILVSGPNTLPVANLTAPADGANYSAPANIALEATASDPDGSIAQVEFLRDGAVLATDTSVPYSYAWNGVGVGSYVLAVRATDNRGGVVTSAPITVTVTPPNSAPSVTLLSPATGSSFAAPATIAMHASASDADGSVAKVDFLRNGIAIATDTIEPYEFVWSDVSPGTYALSTRATDNVGATSASAVATVTVTNANPTVTLLEPGDGDMFHAPATVTLAASATDTDGSIARVEFYEGASLLGTVTAPPYTLEWVFVMPGAYTFTARAVDNDGGSATSSPVTITLNNSPVVELTSPGSGSSFNSPADIPLTASASDSDGQVVRVEFFNGSTLIATDIAAPYSFQWTGVRPGAYQLTARATDDRGAVTVSDSVPITVTGVRPGVLLTKPANDSVHYDNIVLEAIASDSDGEVVRVDFYGDGSLLGSDNSAPYSYTWANAAQGSHSLTAKAVDNDGLETMSAAVTITVSDLQIQITEPSAGVMLAGDQTVVRGTIIAPFNSGVTVNGVVAAMRGNEFYANVALAADGNQITATLATPQGSTREHSISVYGGEPQFLRVTADRYEGIAPIGITFTMTNTAVVEANVVINGQYNSVVPPNSEHTVEFNFTSPFAYPIEFSATNSLGQTANHRFIVVVASPEEMDQKLGAIWNGMNNALLAGDKSSALAFLSAQAQEKYGPVFDVITPGYAEFAGSLSGLQRGMLTVDLGEYAVNRHAAGTNRIYFIYFVRGGDGVWRLAAI